VALPDATLASESHAATTRAVNQAAVTWLAPYPALTLTGATIAATPARSTGILSLTLAQLQPLVQSWLAAGGTGTLQIAQLAKNGDTVSVELKGPSAPPPASPATDTQKARAAVTDWLAANPGPEILSVTVAGGTATIDLAGPDPSQVAAGLWTALQAQLGPGTTIVIRFAQLKILTP
jgi:hypothetical protein